MKTNIPRNRSRWNSALTRIEVMVIIGILFAGACFAYFIPLFIYGPANPRVNCANNLKQIGMSFEFWAGDNQDRYPMHVPMAQGGTLESVWTGLASPHFRAISNELEKPELLHCPSDTKRTIATNFTTTLTDWQISYFVGLDASKSTTNSWLSGDRSLTTNGFPVVRGLVAIKTNAVVGWQANRHNAGNIVLEDGSVQQPSTTRLPSILSQTGLATNRFAVP